MDIDCLESFLSVFRLGSFTRAAEARHLTQPAVSRQIQRLEEDLGVKLFVHIGRRVEPSAEGKLVAEEGAQLLGRIKGLRSALEEIATLNRGELRVGASSTPGMYMIPALLGEFRNKHPGVTLHYELSNSQAIERMLVHNDIELGFVGEEVSSEHTVSQALADDSICFVAAAAHPLASRRTVALEAILADHYIAREQGSATRRVLDQYLAERGKHWQPFLELGSVEAVKHAVAAGLGIAAISRIAVEWELQSGRLALLRVPKTRMTRKLFVLYRKELRLSAAAASFLAMAERTRRGNRRS